MDSRPEAVNSSIVSCVGMHRMVCDRSVSPQAYIRYESHKFGTEFQQFAELRDE